MSTRSWAVMDLISPWTTTQRKNQRALRVRSLEINSNYWTPTLWFQHKNGSFESIKQVGGVTVYYLQRGTTGEKLKAFPPGFRMVAGDPFKRSDSNDFAAQAVSYNCLNYNGPAKKETGYFPNYNCPDGLRTQVFFPSCWNGKDLDTPDHKSHMSYPANSYNGGPRPAGFPVHFISIFYEIIWETGKFKDLWYGNSQPFVWSNGDPTGYGGHGDFVMGWDYDLLQKAVDTCNAESGRVEDCPAFKLISDNQAQGCMISPKINESTSGVLDKLPGCNPVQAGPNRATQQTGCGATTEIGQPTTNYSTDLTSQRWSYMGCGTDSVSNRTLRGTSFSADDMTNKKCVDYCTSKGFSIAGTEYSRECFCDNSISDANKPVHGVIGNCQMTCSGDSSQFCGGSARMSLYQKCTGKECKNADIDGRSSSSPATTTTSASTGLTSTTSSTSKSGSTIPISSASTSKTTLSPSSLTTPTIINSSISTSRSASSTASSSSLTTKPQTTSTTSTTTAPSRTTTTTSPTSKTSSTTSSTPTYSLTSTNKNLKLPNGWAYTGCFTDSLNPRTLSTWSNFNGDNMTSTKCVTFCSSRNFIYAGTEFRGQCFCGNELSQTSQKSDESCNMACSGDAKEFCGGSALLSVFKRMTNSKRSFRRRYGHGGGLRRDF